MEVSITHLIVNKCLIKFKHTEKWLKKTMFIKISIGNDCNCRDWHGCIMAQSIVGLENVQPYKFSECSKTDYIEALKSGHGGCLFNKPNEVRPKRTNDVLME